MISAMNSQDSWDLGLNVFSGLGFWVLGLGCRVWGSKFGVYGVGFCVLRVGFRVCSSLGSPVVPFYPFLGVPLLKPNSRKKGYPYY